MKFVDWLSVGGEKEVLGDFKVGLPQGYKNDGRVNQSADEKTTGVSSFRLCISSDNITFT